MKAIWNDTVIAESVDTVMVESNHYFPLSAVNGELLKSSDTTSFCPWKGTANYYSLEVNGELNTDAAWYYAEPKAAASEIQGRVAFWKGGRSRDEQSLAQIRIQQRKRAAQIAVVQGAIGDDQVRRQIR